MDFRKLDYIDALRGLAILAVIIVHTNQYGRQINNDIVNKIINEGARGVQLFYIASAFTLFLSFKNRTSFEKNPIKNFFIRRFFRIAPMYYIGIGYYLFQDGLGPRYWLGDLDSISFSNILSNIFFIHGFNPYWITSVVPGGWSIAVEMTFYAIVPILYHKIKSANQAFNFFLITIFIKLGLQILFTRYPLIGFDRLWKEYLFLYFPSQLPVFSLGILMFFFLNTNKQEYIISGKAVLILSCLCLLQLAMGINFILPNPILFGISFLILSIGLSRYRSRVIVNPIINYIGKISFSMYLVHFAVLHWLDKANFINYCNQNIVNFFLRFIITVIISILISTILYRIIEVPFQEFGKKIIKRIEAQNT